MSEDLIMGVGAIAEHVYGEDNVANRRKIYANTAQLPLFRMGGYYCVRRSTIETFIKQREAAAILAMQQAEHAADDARL
jgi:hypothetical protein